MLEIVHGNYPSQSDKAHTIGARKYSNWIIRLVNLPTSKCYNVEILACTGNILYGTELGKSVPDTYIALPVKYSVLPDRY